MEKITFNDLPQAVSLLTREVGELKNLLLEQKKSSSEKKQEILLTAKEAADFLNLSIATIYSKVSRQELPVMKRGKRLYFSRTELFQYVKQGKKRSFDELNAEAESFLLTKTRA